MKKRSFKRSVIAMMMAMVLLVSPMQVFAEEVPTEARYDLEKGGTQTFVVQDENGEIGTVTVEELEGNSRVADSNYRISYDNTVWQAAFSISVANNKIYNAFDPYYFCLFGEIKYPAISRPSTTHAIFAFIYKYNQLNHSTGIDVQIINSEIVVERR